MTVWTSDEIDRIGDSRELSISARRPDGTLRSQVPIWVVRDGDELYIRSYRGEDGAWYRAARESGAAHIRAGGVEKDVAVIPVSDPSTQKAVDDAYNAKYRSHGAAYVAPMTATAARATTLKLTPR